jgi:glycosyltransferase involved in cell wall biosynthesis
MKTDPCPVDPRDSDRAFARFSPAARPAAIAVAPAPAPSSSKPIRVLQVITRLNVGGPARHTVALDEGLRALGFAPMLVYGAEDAREGSLEDLLGARDVRALRIERLRRRVQPWSDLGVLYQLTRLIFLERPDVVHTHTAKAGTIGRLAAFAYNVTRRRGDRCVVVHTFHGHVFSGYFGALGSGAVRLIERAMSRVTDRILTVSQRQKADICDRYRIAPAGKTDVLELGSDLEPLFRLEANTSLREALGFAPRHVVFGFVGRFVPIKDLPTLVRAFAQVAARVPDARLMLVGDGELRSAIERLVIELQLSDRVRFTGWVRDIQAIYGALDVAVLPSINEGTPLVLLEAMAAGRPVIATAVGGVEDIVSRDRMGLLVPPRDVRALAEAMARLAECPAMRGELGAAARRGMSVRFGRDGVVHRVAALYQGLLAQRGPRRSPGDPSLPA